MAVATLGLRRATTAPVTAEVRDVDGRQIVWVELGGETASGFRGVPLSSTTSAIVQQAATVARTEGMPLVVVMASTGADIVEGVAALEGWGRLAKALVDCSGIVPTIMVVDGPAVSGPALLLGVADLVVMTETSYAFVNGPVMVEEFTGVRVTTDELGGAGELARHTGVPSLVVVDRDAAVDAVADLLAYLPQSVDDDPPEWPTRRPGRSGLCPEAGALIPPTSTGSYDVRAVAAAIVDADTLLEVRDRWAPNVVTAFAAIDGRPVGIVANQPLALAGTLDIPASQKAARFVAFCDAFNLPLADAGRHARLLPRQGPRVAGHDPPRRPAGVRLRPGDGAADLPDPAQELRRGVHRHGLQDDGQRRLLRVAVGRAGRDGRRAGGGDPAAAGDAGGAGGVRGRLRRATAQPVRRRRARLRRRRASNRPTPAARSRARSTVLADKREHLQARKHGNEPC